MKYTFSGPTEQVYPQYLDVTEAHTLCAQPGGTYEIAQVDGLIFPDGKGGFVDAVMPMPPDDRWSEAGDPPPSEPSPNAPKAEWVAWAIAHDVDTDIAQAMTKTELIELASADKSKEDS